MQNRITPAVFNIIFLNILVFVVINLKPTFQEYFVLKKANYFGLREEIRIEGRKTYIVGKKFDFDTGREIRYYSNPGTAEFRPYQLVTSFFGHIEVWHIAMNMLTLFFIGSMLEMTMGLKRFVEFYLFAGVFSGILIALFDPSSTPVLGASGAISGLFVLLAYYYPHARFSFMFIPVGIPARILAPALAGISLLFVLLQLRNPETGGGISHFGHLMGMVAGFLFFHRHKILPKRRS